MLNSAHIVMETECKGLNSLMVQLWNYANAEIWLYTCAHTSTWLPVFVHTAKCKTETITCNLDRLIEMTNTF